jgi:plastocyanin
VALSEFAITMPTELAAGPTQFNVSNVGQAQHNFVIEGNGVAEQLAENLGPRQSGSITLDLAPGTYTVFCPVGQGAHRANGMELTLTVT